MTSPQFSDFLTPLPPHITPVKPWKSPQIFIFCIPLPLWGDVIYGWSLTSIAKNRKISKVTHDHQPNNARDYRVLPTKNISKVQSLGSLREALISSTWVYCHNMYWLHLSVFLKSRFKSRQWGPFKISTEPWKCVTLHLTTQFYGRNRQHARALYTPYSDFGCEKVIFPRGLYVT